MQKIQVYFVVTSMMGQLCDSMYRKLPFCNPGTNGARVKANDMLAASKINWWRVLGNDIERFFLHKSV